LPVRQPFVRSGRSRSGRPAQGGQRQGNDEPLAQLRPPTRARHRARFGGPCAFHYAGADVRRFRRRPTAKTVRTPAGATPTRIPMAIVRPVSCAFATLAFGVTVGNVSFIVRTTSGKSL